MLAEFLGHDSASNLGYPPLDLREVVLTSVGTRERGLEVRVLEAGRHAHDTVTLVRRAPADAEVSCMLQEWCVLHTPMLLYVDSAGSATLHGPAADITGLRNVAACGAPGAAGTSHP